jgi:hypothetical protein
LFEPSLRATKIVEGLAENPIPNLTDGYLIRYEAQVGTAIGVYFLYNHATDQK